MVAKNFNEIKEMSLPLVITKDPYINSFAELLMQLSNELDMEEDEGFDDLDYYRPAIQEFIYNITGL